MPPTPPFFPALKNSIDAKSLEKLQVNLQAMDKPVQYALCAAARNGFVEAVPLLWERLSPGGKQQFFDDKIIENGYFQDYKPPLHEAVKHGHFDMVNMLVGVPYSFRVNQKDCSGNSPLVFAVKNLEITRFLLENGADVSRGGESALSEAVIDKNITVARLLLQYGADPNLNRAYPTSILAIQTGDLEMLSILLQHGSLVGSRDADGDLMEYYDGTSLNELLNDNRNSRETKVAISQMLVDHVKKDHDTLLFLQSSLEYAIEYSDKDDDDDYDDNILILLEAGMVPHTQAFYVAIRERSVSVCQLLVRHGGNPFLQVSDNIIEPEEECEASSPFVAAARLDNILIFAYFLDLWYDERFFSASHGKKRNSKQRDDDDPLHLICRDPHVSLQAITLVVARQVEAMTTLSVGQDGGLFPFQLAAVANADLDIIFYLLNRRPDALRQFRILLAAGTDPMSTTGNKKGRKRKKQEQEENQVERTISS